MYRPSILVIMETICDPNRPKKTFKLLGFNGLHCINVRGYAGGVVVSWREYNVSMNLVEKNYNMST